MSPLPFTERRSAMDWKNGMNIVAFETEEPHVAYNTEEALRRILDATLANIEALALGGRRTSYRMRSEIAPGAGGS